MIQNFGDVVKSFGLVPLGYFLSVIIKKKTILAFESGAPCPSREKGEL